MMAPSWHTVCLMLLGGAAAACGLAIRDSNVEPHLMRRDDWQPNQVNQTMCWWEQPRSAVLRDTLFLDGGYISYVLGFANGTVGAPVQPGMDAR